MTDNEIIKALEYCLAQGITSECERCRDTIGCRDTLLRDALDLINRKKAKIRVKDKLLAKAEAKIKALQMDNKQLENDIFNANMNLEHLQAEIEKYTTNFGRVSKLIKVEARKELAERLKKKLKMPVGTILGVMVYTDDIDNLLAEMESEGV